MSWLFASGGQSVGASASASSPSNECLGLISFRIDWFGLLASPRDADSLLQHHSSKASILWRLAFFLVQFSHPYMTTGKTIALTCMDLCQQNDALFFNMLSRFVITFLPRSKCHLISWLQSPSAVILEAKIIRVKETSGNSPAPSSM